MNIPTFQPPTRLNDGTNVATVAVVAQVFSDNENRTDPSTFASFANSDRANWYAEELLKQYPVVQVRMDGQVYRLRKGENSTIQQF